MARHKLQHLKQNDMPMHEYISKFTNLVEHAYGLSSHAHSSFTLVSTFIEGIMSPSHQEQAEVMQSSKLKGCILPCHPGRPEAKVEGFGF